MSVAWFRTPAGVLVAARNERLHDRYVNRGYEPIAADDAEAEIAAGKQAELNAERRESDRTARERELARERQRKAEERRARARATVADALTPPPGDRGVVASGAEVIGEANMPAQDDEEQGNG